MSNKPDKEPDARRSGGNNVNQDVDGNGNTTVGVGEGGTVTVNPASGEGQAANDMLNIAIAILRSMFCRLFKTHIGGYIDVVAAPLGITGFTAIIIGVVGSGVVKMANVGQEPGSPLFPEYINPAAAFIESYIIPVMDWIVASTPSLVLMISAGIVFVSVIYSGMKKMTYCQNCEEEFMIEPVAIEYPQRQYINNNGQEVVPREEKYQCQNCGLCSGDM